MKPDVYYYSVKSYGVKSIWKLSLDDKKATDTFTWSDNQEYTSAWLKESQIVELFTSWTKEVGDFHKKMKIITEEEAFLEMI